MAVELDVGHANTCSHGGRTDAAVIARGTRQRTGGRRARPAPGNPHARARPRPAPRGGGHQVRVEQRARQRRAELHALETHRAVDAVAPLRRRRRCGRAPRRPRPGAGAGRRRSRPPHRHGPVRMADLLEEARAPRRRLSGSVRSRCVSSTYVRTWPVGADSGPTRRLQARGQVERPAVDAGGEHHQIDGAPGGVVGHRVALAVGARARRAGAPVGQRQRALDRALHVERAPAACSRRSACRRRPARTARASRPAGCRAAARAPARQAAVAVALRRRGSARRSRSARRASPPRTPQAPHRARRRRGRRAAPRCSRARASRPRRRSARRRVPSPPRPSATSRCAPPLTSRPRLLAVGDA